MGISRSQIRSAFRQIITDALQKQNTAAKVKAALDLLNDNQFNAEDDELTIYHIHGLPALLGFQPQIPLGVAWITKPGAPVISNHSITETSSVVDNEGVTVNVAGATVDVPFAAAGGRRTDAIVINYLATPAIYERIPGEEESELSPSPTPTIPDNRLFVRYVIASDGIIEVVPNPTFTPITENEFGTHPAFTNQHDVNAYLLSGGTYTPPTGGGSAPVVTSFSPSTGEETDMVTITGNGFTGATSVTINGTAASFTVISDTEINVTVPVGATAGKIAVTTPNGTAQSAGSFSIITALSEYKLIVDGNSHLAGGEILAKLLTMLPDLMVEHNIAGSFTSSVNYAVAGQSTANMLADAETQIDTAYDSGKTVNILMVWELTNDLYFNPVALDCYNNLKNYCIGRKAANPNLKIAVGTAMPRANTGTPAGYEAARIAANQMVRDAYEAGESWLDALADIAADDRLGDEGDEYNAQYFSGSDLVHLTDAGRNVATPYFARAILQAGFGAEFSEYQIAEPMFVSSSKITQAGTVLTATESPAGYGHTGIFQYMLPANQDGGVMFLVESGDQNAILGFAVNNAATPYSSMKAGVWLSTDDIGKVDNGATSTVTKPVSFNSVKLYRESGVFKVYTSTDTKNWVYLSDVATNSGELYLVIDISGGDKIRGIRAIGMDEKLAESPVIDWDNATQFHVSGTGNIDEAAGVFTPQAGTSGYGGQEIFGLKLPAGVDGWFGYEVDATKGDTVLGLVTSNVLSGYGAMKVGLQNSGNFASKVDNNAFSAAGGVSNGDYYIAYRQSGVWKLFAGQPGGALSFVSAITYADNVDLFAAVNMYETGGIKNIRGFGFVAA